MTSILNVSGISKAYGGLQALNDCSFDIDEGKITCLVGPNGAGKTSIFNAITGFLNPDQGIVTFRGEEITRLKPQSIVDLGIARTFQNLRLFPEMSVLDNVMVFQPTSKVSGPLAAIFRPFAVQSDLARRRAEARAILDQVGLSGRDNETVGNMSYGEQKLLCVARVLATGADILLLDEPASGMGHEALNNMVDLVLRLKSLGKTLVVVEHNTRIVQKIADEILFLHQGHLLAKGAPDTIIRDPKLAEIYFGGVI